MASSALVPAPTVARPASIEEAVRALAAEPGAVPLAGGTWIMRAGLRGEPASSGYVSLDRIAELREIHPGPPLRLGAGVTHPALAAQLSGVPGLAGLRDAAATSANPAVRQVATVGGALATAAFPASDLVPALLALDAQIALASPDGTSTEPLTTYVESRRDGLVTAITIPATPSRSAHARLTLRSAGDYPVAIVAAAEVAGVLRIAIGSVEAAPRRWTALEAALADATAPDAGAAEAAAAALRDDLAPRDGVDAPGWYRAQVLPTLVRRAVAALTEED